MESEEQGETPEILQISMKRFHISPPELLKNAVNLLLCLRQSRVW
jgi:hypothetical protein